jgi:hypothetical protein
MLRSRIIIGIVRSAKSPKINRAGLPFSTDGNALATSSAEAKSAPKHSTLPTARSGYSPARRSQRPPS